MGRWTHNDILQPMNSHENEMAQINYILKNSNSSGTFIVNN